MESKSMMTMNIGDDANDNEGYKGRGLSPAARSNRRISSFNVHEKTNSAALVIRECLEPGGVNWRFGAQRTETVAFPPLTPALSPSCPAFAPWRGKGERGEARGRIPRLWSFEQSGRR